MTAMPGAVCLPPQSINISPSTDLTIVLDFPHDHARSRAFRWGEDGIAGVSDTHGWQNIGFSFWNEKEYVPLPTNRSPHLVDTSAVPF